MADSGAPKSQPPLPKKRAIQRCPNCDIRCDVSLFVDGSLARCGHCGVRFEVHRVKSTPPRAVPLPEPPKFPPPPEAPSPRLLAAVPPAPMRRAGAGEDIRCTRTSAGPWVAATSLTPITSRVPADA